MVVKRGKKIVRRQKKKKIIRGNFNDAYKSSSSSDISITDITRERSPKVRRPIRPKINATKEIQTTTETEIQTETTSIEIQIGKLNGNVYGPTDTKQPLTITVNGPIVIHPTLSMEVIFKKLSDKLNIPIEDLRKALENEPNEMMHVGDVETI